MSLPSRYLYGFFISLAVVLIACGQKQERIRNARKFINEWNYERAISELISFREDKDPAISYILGYCYLRKNETAEAANYFSRTLAEDSTFADSIAGFYTRLAKNALKVNETNRAVQLYDELSKLVPNAVGADDLFLIGDVNYDQGNHLVVIQAYQKALAIDSLSSTARKARNRLIRSLLASDSFAHALVLAKVEYQRSKIADNVLQLGEITYAVGKKYFESQMYDSAMAYFDEVLGQQEPKSLLDDVYFHLGEIYLRQDSLTLALDAYKKVLRLNPYQKGDLVAKAQARIKEIKEK
ncbi:MAG TPA: tetratricopeptide repeat protein [bacterium]